MPIDFTLPVRGLPQELVFAPSEHGFRRRVPELNAAGRIVEHDRQGRRLDEAAQFLVGLSQRL